MTTIHAYTNDQKILDQIHPDLRRARAAGDVDHPDHHRRRPRGRRGAARAEGQARRLGDPRADAQRQPDRPDLHAGARHHPRRGQCALKAARESGPLKGILAYTDEPLVSIDLNHTPASSTVDSLETAVLEGKLVRVVSWYDNEWGFSNRMVDTAAAMAKLGWRGRRFKTLDDLPDDLDRQASAGAGRPQCADGRRVGQPTTRGCARCCRRCSNLPTAARSSCCCRISAGPRGRTAPTCRLRSWSSRCPS